MSARESLFAVLRGDAQGDRVVPPSGYTARLTGFTAGAMAFLAVFALALSLAAGRLADRWSDALADTATIRISAPDDQISAAVFPNPADGVAKKFQNWADWVAKGYVDILTGMSFGTSAESVARETALMRTAVGDRNLLYTATYGPFHGSTPDVIPPEA